MFMPSLGPDNLKPFIYKEFFEILKGYVSKVLTHLSIGRKGNRLVELAEILVFKYVGQVFILS